MTHTYTINNTTANSGTITLTGAGLGGTGGAGNITLNGGSHIYTTNTTGPFLTSTGNGTSWNTGSNITNSEVMRINQTNPPSLEVKGKMFVNGIDIEERLSTIEKVLQIPERDVILEKKHPKLKKLYDEYIAALGKYRTFEAIKGDE